MSDKKKPGFFQKLFSSKSYDDGNEKEKKKAHKTSSDGHGKTSGLPKVKVDPPPTGERKAAAGGVSRSAGQASKGSRQQKRLSRKKAKKGAKGADITPADPDQKLEFPMTPEMILAHHKRKPLLSRNEEWLVVELNEYECLVDNLDIIKTIANHSKFFEVEPDELWEEFFEYVEDMPSYDEVINYDVWQEFRDDKYPC